MVGNSVVKDLNKTIRLSQEQWRRAVRAAELETVRLGEQVYPTPLLAELGTTGIDEILRKAGDPLVSQSALAQPV